ncbi:MAG: hypothetical protein UV61_C0001G0108 [Candidatus Gottesmanbacteria bacterium GW2011_GWB1_43_11]|uniref:Uncharacterized protein n=1 Tax=Candidatus Gottesmanbacteria bacterium GW2011_GWB1_43_11 TaxID=1618446 RepID=A0A0G1EXM6_9BACT|nr:MAG: hypothetical protein UV04_C0004G0050 [Candidatus Gottesmanbacteria bacterium GW2011_GWA2_42_16]KKS56073.1 MAG: hypothetical protein UV17_C0003G0045 [Candidatus Gottesmanbacteria bacterium GW2011_GWA1_42_26]KKS81616.1 MAG: hypothetical protein UV55_C0011G0010 [Candidatus Gottesmanbacteria bacterium GW2011_GWC1_43_10]KKS87701.1 MAG: hypothetical protein UV61_C0001G0108 [Candidatus Gottesmanbacteria bacterium GW2011_GWB1_43_11]OGG07515.1 MAG: hypothetical protein A2699_00515 [Candidatus Go
MSETVEGVLKSLVELEDQYPADDYLFDKLTNIRNLIRGELPPGTEIEFYKHRSGNPIKPLSIDTKDVLFETLQPAPFATRIKPEKFLGSSGLGTRTTTIYKTTAPDILIIKTEVYHPKFDETLEQYAIYYDQPGSNSILNRRNLSLGGYELI